MPGWPPPHGSSPCLPRRRAILGSEELFRDKVVLDVGAGLGVTAMMAAKVRPRALWRLWRLWGSAAGPGPVAPVGLLALALWRLWGSAAGGPWLQWSAGSALQHAWALACCTAPAWQTSAACTAQHPQAPSTRSPQHGTHPSTSTPPLPALPAGGRSACVRSGGLRSSGAGRQGSGCKRP